MATATITSTNEPVLDLEAGEQTPLVDKKPNFQEYPPLQDMKAETYKEQIVAVLAGVGSGSALLALLFASSGNPTILFSGSLGVGLSPYAAFQQRKLTEAEALEQLNQHMDAEMDQLMYENKRLAGQVRELKDTIGDLNAMAETLNTVQSTQGGNIEELKQQLEQSKGILSSFGANVNARLMQNFTRFFQSADEDGIVTQDEARKLLEDFEKMADVDLNDKLILRIFEENKGDMWRVFEELNNYLHKQDDPNSEHIYHISENWRKNRPR